MNKEAKSLTGLLMRSNRVEGRVLVNITEIEKKGDNTTLYILGSDNKITFSGEESEKHFHVEDHFDNHHVVGVNLEVHEVKEVGDEDILVELSVQGSTDGKMKMNGEEAQEFLNIDRMNIYRDLNKEERKEMLDNLVGQELNYLDFEEELEMKLKVLSNSDFDTVTMELNGQVGEFIFDDFLMFYHEYLLFQEFVEQQEIENLHGDSNIIGPDGQLLSNFEVRLERMRKQEEEMMNEYGFLSHCVFPTGGEGMGLIDFHTHGFEQNYGHKDIQMVLPIDAQTLNVIAHAILEKIVKKGLKLEEQTHNVIDNFDVEIMEVEDEEGRRLLRIMFPDPQGKLPSDPLCELMYKKQLKKELFK